MTTISIEGPFKQLPSKMLKDLKNLATNLIESEVAVDYKQTHTQENEIVVCVSPCPEMKITLQTELALITLGFMTYNAPYATAVCLHSPTLNHRPLVSNYS